MTNVCQDFNTYDIIPTKKAPANIGAYIWGCLNNIKQ